MITSLVKYFAYVRSSNGEFPTAWFSVIAAVLACVWIRQRHSMRKRSTEIAAVATRLGLRSWPDGSPPLDLSLRGTSFDDWAKLFNIYEGLLNCRQVAVLDFRKRAGKSAWSRTIIAVKTDKEIFANKPFELEIRQVGDWQLLYRPLEFVHSSNLMDVYQIEALLKDIQRAEVPN